MVSHVDRPNGIATMEAIIIVILMIILFQDNIHPFPDFLFQAPRIQFMLILLTPLVRHIVLLLLDVIYMIDTEMCVNMVFMDTRRIVIYITKSIEIHMIVSQFQ